MHMRSTAGIPRVFVLLIVSSLGLTGCAIFSPDQGPRHHRGWESRIPPEWRERYAAARARAMNDPAVQAAQARRQKANSDYHKALRQAMLREDPGLPQLNAGNAGEGTPR